MFAVTATGVAANVLPAAVVPEVLSAVGGSPAWAGVFLAAGTLPGIVVAPLIGMLADRWGRRALLIPCLALVAAAGVLHAVAGALWLLLLLRFLQGVGSAGLINLAVVLVADHWHGEHRIRMLGRNAAVLTLALALLPFVGGAVTDLVGWRALFVLFAVALAPAFAARRGLRAVPPPGPQESLRGQLVASAAVVRDWRTLAALSATMVTLALLFGSILTIVPVLSALELGLDPTQRGLLMGVPTVGTLVASLQARRGVARLGQRRVLVLAALALAVALVALAQDIAVAGMVAALVVYGFGHGWAVPSLQAVVATAAPPGRVATTLSLQAGFVRLGQTVGPVLGSGAYGALGRTPSFLVFSGLAIALWGLISAAVPHRASRGGAEAGLDMTTENPQCPSDE